MITRVVWIVSARVGHTTFLNSMLTPPTKALNKRPFSVCRAINTAVSAVFSFAVRLRTHKMLGAERVEAAPSAALVFRNDRRLIRLVVTIFFCFGG